MYVPDFEWINYGEYRKKNIEYEHYSMLVHNGNEIKSYFPLSVRVLPFKIKNISFQGLADAIHVKDMPEGKMLDSWRTKKNCQGEKYDFSTVIDLDNDITLYPCYKDAPIEEDSES